MSSRVLLACERGEVPLLVGILLGALALLLLLYLAYLILTACAAGGMRP